MKGCLGVAFPSGSSPGRIWPRFLLPAPAAGEKSDEAAGLGDEANPCTCLCPVFPTCRALGWAVSPRAGMRLLPAPVPLPGLAGGAGRGAQHTGFGAQLVQTCPVLHQVGPGHGR